MCAECWRQLFFQNPAAGGQCTANAYLGRGDSGRGNLDQIKVYEGYKSLPVIAIPILWLMLGITHTVPFVSRVSGQIFNIYTPLLRQNRCGQRWGITMDAVLIRQHKQVPI